MLKWGGGRRGWDGGKEKEEGVLLFPPFPSIRVQGGWVALSPLWVGGHLPSHSKDLSLVARRRFLGFFFLRNCLAAAAAEIA